VSAHTPITDISPSPRWFPLLTLSGRRCTAEITLFRQKAT